MTPQKNKKLQYYQTQKNQTGFGVLEIIIVVLVFALGLLAMMQFYRLALSKSSSQQNQTKGTYLASSTLEAVRQIRDRDWSNIDSLNTDQDYRLSKSGIPPEWGLVSGIETIDQFQRSVKFFDVRRDTNDNIVESGGNLDSDTKKVIAIVSWQKAGQTHQVELVTYLTNWQGY